MTRFRIRIAHPAFTATVEGAWSFENEKLSQVRFTRAGDPEMIESAVDAMIEALDGGEVEDEEFAEFLEALEDDDDEVPLIGDDPTEPPEATALERNRLKAIAKRVARGRDTEIIMEDRGWLEQTPQLLPVITEALIASAAPLNAMKASPSYQSPRPRSSSSSAIDRIGVDWAPTCWTRSSNGSCREGRRDPGRIGSACSAMNEARVPVDDDLQIAADAL